MNKILLTLLTLILTTSNINAHEHHGVPECMIFTESKEVNIDSNATYFYIPFQIYFIDTFNTDSLKIALELPKFSEVSSENPYFTDLPISLSNTTYYPGDSLLDSIKVNYSLNHLPYHLQTLELEMQRSNGESIYGSESVKIYLTPYNTFEIWNLADFEGLIRLWDTPNIKDDSLRNFVHKDSIPISNLVDSIYFLDSMPISYLTVPGLAYSIPMQKILDTFDYPTNNNSTIYRANGCGANRNRW